MSVVFVLGRAGSGKTHYCLSGIQRELASADERRLILLTPEQASLQMERALAAGSPRGGYWRAEVLSFSRLARRVLSESGAAPLAVGQAARAMALRLIVQRAAPRLTALPPQARTAGFYRELDRLVGECLHENVTPAALQSAAAGMDDAAAAARLGEIAGLYQDYLEWLGAQRHDSDDVQRILRGQLERTEWLRGAWIWVDGFAGFPAQELDTLTALARLAARVYITLLVEPAALGAAPTPGEHSLFSPTERTYHALARLLRDAGVQIDAAVVLDPAPPPRFRAAPLLGRLEAALAGAADSDAPATDARAGVRLIACATPRDECRAAARFIRTRVVESGGALSYRDFAVIARDLSPLADLAAEVFDEYGIPYFLDQRRRLRSHALCRLVDALLEAVAGDLAQAPMLRALRTDLLPLSPPQRQRLDNILTRECVCGLVQWERACWPFAGADALSPAGERARRRIAGALGGLNKLAHSGQTTGSEWATGLLAALQALHVDRRLGRWMAEARAAGQLEAAELHRQAWDALIAALETLHDVLGANVVSVDELRDVLTGALADATVGMAPPTLDQVLISSIERSRHPDIRCAWLIGFNEGVFPQPPAEPVLLSAAHRASLARGGLDALAQRERKPQDERLLAYIAMTRPSQELVISFAQLGADGEKRAPSPLLCDVQAALPGLRIEAARMEVPASAVEFAESVVAAERGRDRPMQQRLDRLRRIIEADPPLAQRIAWLLRGRAYSNCPGPIGNFRRAANLPEEVVWAASAGELERYLRCPYKHFATHGLRLDVPRHAADVSIELGQFAHAVLATAARAVIERKLDVRAIKHEEWVELAADALRSERAKYPDDLGQRRPELALLLDLESQRLREALRVQAERWRRGRFSPRFIEHAFDASGDEGTSPPLVVALETGQSAWLTGRIDRVDEAPTRTGRLWLAYDYKTRVPATKKPYLLGDVLQLYLYLAALRGLIAPDDPVELGGMLVAPYHADDAVLDTAYVVNAPADEQRLFLHRPRGLFTPAAADALDPSIRKPSPVAWINRSSDGELAKSTEVCEPEGIAVRIALALETVRQAAAGVAAGAIDVAPLVEDGSLACGRCDFGPLCRYEREMRTARNTDALPRLPAASADTAADEEQGGEPS